MKKYKVILLVRKPNKSTHISVVMEIMANSKEDAKYTAKTLLIENLHIVAISVEELE